MNSLRYEHPASERYHSVIARVSQDVQFIPDPESDGGLLVHQDSFVVARVNKTGRMILDLAEHHATWDEAARELASIGGCTAEYAATVIREYVGELARTGWLEQLNPQEAELRP